jgi:hypothetical protein
MIQYLNFKHHKILFYQLNLLYKLCLDYLLKILLEDYSFEHLITCNLNNFNHQLFHNYHHNINMGLSEDLSNKTYHFYLRMPPFLLYLLLFSMDQYVYLYFIHYLIMRFCLIKICENQS